MAEATVCVLGLACCGVEAAAGRADQILAPAASSDEGSAGGGITGSVLVVAGTVTTKLAGRLRATYESLPAPVSVIAYGACAISGGPYWDSYSVLPGADQVIPVTLAVAGCPPRPADLELALAALRPAMAVGRGDPDQVHTLGEQEGPP